MSTALALILGGAALYGAAGYTIVSHPDRAARLGRRVLLPHGLVGLLGLAVASWGACLLYRCFVSPDEIESVRLAVLAGLSIVPVGLLAALMFLLAVLPPDRGNGGRGGDDDLPPPPDPDGPDGWAEFERGFREYAAVRETLRVASPVR